MNLRNASLDPEKGCSFLKGYPKIARWYAEDPDCETFVFRKFDELSARNLLRLQSEMCYLESQLRVLDRTMCSGNDPDKWRTLLDYEASKRHAQTLTQDEQKKLILEKELAIKIKEYHEALLLQSQIIGLNQPSNRLLRIFSNFFTKNNTVVNWTQGTLNDPNDLVTLRPPLDTDPLSDLVRKYWMGRSKVLVGADERAQWFLESHVQRVVITISTIFAAILLVGAVTSLFFVRNTKAKLGVLAGFTSLFAASVGGLTSAKRQEVFAATAAYAAVLVVFVSGDFDRDSGG